MNAYNEDPVNRFVREAKVATYVCPTEEETDKLDYPESGPSAGILYGRGSYRCMVGRTVGGAALTGWGVSGETT